MTNQYTYNVPFSEEQLFNDYCNNNMTQAEIAEKYKVSQKVVWRAMQKMGIQARVAKARNQNGENNQNWKGGRVLVATKASGRFSDRGYWYIKKPDHPNANKTGYVAEHVLIATTKANRPLEKGECVHHKDLNKRNNTPENLVICDRKQHREYHLQLELIAVELYRNGLVEFEAGNYQITKELQEVLNARE